MLQAGPGGGAAMVGEGSKPLMSCAALACIGLRATSVYLTISCRILYECVPLPISGGLTESRSKSPVSASARSQNTVQAVCGSLMP